MFEFNDVGNYRGNIQVQENGGHYFWRVDCDVDDEPWQEIPKYLYEALKQFYTEHF